MTAAEKFFLGQTVRLTAKGQDLVLTKRSRTVPPYVGIVRGFGRSGRHVRVQREGHQTVQSWHMEFWEPVDA